MLDAVRERESASRRTGEGKAVSAARIEGSPPPQAPPTMALELALTLLLVHRTSPRSRRAPTPLPPQQPERDTPR